MYAYNEQDQRIIDERAAQYKDQTNRYLDGKLSDDEFLVLRLQNGLYLQRHAPMLRIGVPHGMLSTRQFRKIAEITREYDKGYAHISTRQNIQLNWPELEEVPNILKDLASVQMHGIQTSGSCIRSTTSDEFAGVAQDEDVDPRPYAEIIRQWSTLHPEFAMLPRKFKISVTGSPKDRAATQTNDIGVQVKLNESGEVVYQVRAGGGLGRTPILGPVIKDFLPEAHLLSYLDAILRVYNRYGRRDNKYKARIKILVKAMKPDVFAEKVEAEWLRIKDGPLTLTEKELSRVKACYRLPDYKKPEPKQTAFTNQLQANSVFAQWVRTNVSPHKVPGYAIANINLKACSTAPGDISAEDIELVSDLADRYSLVN